MSRQWKWKLGYVRAWRDAVRPHWEREEIRRWIRCWYDWACSWIRDGAIEDEISPGEAAVNDMHEGLS